MSCFLSTEFLCQTARFAYPAYATIQLLNTETTSTTHDAFRQWTTYWVTVSVVQYFGLILSPILDWVPFRFELEALFCLWLQHPRFKGSLYIYMLFFSEAKKDGVTMVDFVNYYAAEFKSFLHDFFYTGKTIEDKISVAQNSPAENDTSNSLLHAESTNNVPTTQQEESKAETELPSTEALEKFLDGLAEENLVDILERLPLKDNVLFALMQLYPQKVRNILAHAASQEINQCEHFGTLFRRNSLYPRLFSASCNIYGKEFLSQAVGHIVKDICTNNFHLEVNPNLVDSECDVEANTTKLLQLTQSFFDGLVKSKESLPREMKEILSDLRNHLKGKYPEQELHVLSSMLFLRFITPSLVAPDWMLDDDEDQEVTSQARRTLTLMAKILQNLANEIEFGVKEKFMMPANQFIQENAHICTKFMGDISVISETESLSSDKNGEQYFADLSSEDKGELFAYLLKFLSKNRQIIKSIDTTTDIQKETDDVPEVCPTEHSRCFVTQLKNILQV